MGVGLQQDIANPPYTFGFPMLSLHELNFVAFYPMAETISGPNFYLHLFLDFMYLWPAILEDHH